MSEVFTPDGWGQVLKTETARGRTSYLVKGAGFEGWYDAIQVTAGEGFAAQPDEVVPNERNNTVLPYPDDPRGPGWDGSTSTISLKPDFHLPVEEYATDSLSGDRTDEDPVEADIEGLFEPHSRVSRVRRLHFAKNDDPILDVTQLPEESPNQISNSPINPDDVDPDDLFADTSDRPHFERGASAVYDRLVIEDGLSFLRYASDDEDDKKDDDKSSDSDDDSDDDRDSEDDDSDSDDDDSDSDDKDSSSDDDDSPFDDDDHMDSHTSSFALTTTADLHFLANLCHCAAALPLHSKSEHRELEVEAAKKRRRGQPLGSKPLQGKHGDQDPHTVEEAGYSKKAKGVKQVVHDIPEPHAAKGQWGTKKRDVQRPIQYAADFSTHEKHQPANGVEPQKRDLERLLERATDDEMQQWTHQESNLENLVDHSLDDGDSGDGYRRTLASVEKHSDGYDKYIGSNGDGTYHLIASGKGKIKTPGEPYGHYDSYEAAHNAVKAIIERNHAHGSVHTAAPAQPTGPTQIESQIEQLMQFWAVDNNGWWHWTGSQADLALLNQMQQQMAMVGAPQGQPGAMQTQSSFSPEPNTPAPWREYLRVIASDRLVALAAWKDVVEKSKRLRAEGAVDVEVFRPDVITAYVQGDHGRYYTTVQRLGSVQGMGRQNLTSAQVSGWSCDCEWGHWAFLRKRSFVGRMCSHAYALFSEMRSLDAKERKAKGKPGRFASVSSKTAWSRNGEGFEWVSDDPMLPTGAITRVASGWVAQVWSDGTADDSLSLGTFSHSEQARRAISRTILAHIKLAADDGDVDLVGGKSYDDPGSDDGADEFDNSPEAKIQESQKTSARSVFAEDHHDDGIEEDDHDDDDSLDQEVADDEDDSDDGSDDDGGEEPSAGEDPDDDQDDGGHYEKHKRDDGDDDEDEGTDNPGDDSDDDHVEKHSSVAELQQQFGLTHLAGADYDPSRQAKLVREGEGLRARNASDEEGLLNVEGTHYAAQAKSPEDVLTFLF